MDSFATLVDSARENGTGTPIGKEWQHSFDQPSEQEPDYYIMEAGSRQPAHNKPAISRMFYNKGVEFYTSTQLDTATSVVAAETASVVPATAGYKIISYQLFAPPKNPVNFGVFIQPSRIFITPSNSQTAPSQTRSGTRRKLGVLLEKCPPRKLLLFLIVKNSCLI